ncbi:MAG: hypothetical protein E7254_11960 [Lachnospiraceae bacterium]|nr:hypothetical protein [Lachnospiraceae bacterium]
MFSKIVEKEKVIILVKKTIKQIIGIAICLLIGFLIGNIVMMYLEKHPIKRSQNIADVAIEKIEIGKTYLIDREKFEDSDVLFETNQLDNNTYLTYYYTMYLVPLDLEKKVYLGVMVEESEVQRKYNDYYKTYVGKISKYDPITKKKIDEKVYELGMDEEGITILPYYLNSADSEKWPTVLIVIPLVGLLTLYWLIRVYLGHKEGRTPDVETVLCLKKAYEKANDDVYIEKYGKLVWIDLDKYATKFIFANMFKVHRKGKNIYSAFRRYYLYRFVKYILIGSVILYIFYGANFSFKITDWYYVLYGNNFPVVVLSVIMIIIAILYIIVACFVNPMGRAIKKYITDSNYPNEYMEAVLSEGRLIASYGGFIYLTDRYIIVGRAYKFMVARLDQIKKITWCKKTEIILRNNVPRNWIRVYNFKGEFGEYHADWKWAYPILKYIKTYLDNHEK